MNAVSYRAVIYAGTILTGFTGLVYQIIWQKYLSFVVGSDARSVSLVVAVFLAGLAAGYRYWGKLTERGYSRRDLLRLYGAIEIGIGIWGLLFPFTLGLVRWVAYHGPSTFLVDVAATLLTLLVPTFLMGATIPLLVGVVPESSKEIHACHAKIYGINTLGACLGSFGASLLLIPELGLAGSLYLAGGLNLVVGTIFMLNQLRHEVAKSEPVEAIQNRFGPPTLYAYTFVTGTVTLSLEVLVVRVLNLTIGAGPHNFAIVVGVFVMGLALGSLTLGSRWLSLTVLFRALGGLLGALVLLYYSVPYWPYWLSNARALLADLPVNYNVYLLIVTLFLAVILLPVLVPMGFMLPLVYSFLPKDSKNYGRTCGRLYFFNTLGTATGAILLSYFLLHRLDLDQVFKVNLGLVAGLAAYLAFRESRRALAAVLIAAGLVATLGPRWDRGPHHQGLFWSPGVHDFNFQGVFQKPGFVDNVAFFDDGPDVTVTVGRYFDDASARPGVVYDGERSPSLTLFNNGRSESHTVLDYSTVALLGVLPYLHAPDRTDLDTAVVGLGGGITAGILGGAEEVQRVRVLEISSTVIEAAAIFDETNWGLSSNPKVEIVPVDAFKFLARLKEPLDLVVSEPSVPWVVGVENLFTPEYYRLVRRGLKDDGLFMQWFPIYSALDDKLARTIVANLQEVFPHLLVYRISRGEVGVLACGSPIRVPQDNRRLAEPVVGEASARIHFEDIDQLALIAELDTLQLRFLAADAPPRPHTLNRPSLAYVSDRLRFVNAPPSIDRFIEPGLTRMTRDEPQRRASFRNLVQEYPGGLQCTQPYSGSDLFCDRLNQLLSSYAAYTTRPEGIPPTDRVAAYERLRKAGVVDKDPAFLASIVQELASTSRSAALSINDVANAIVVSYTNDALWDEARRDVGLLRSHGLIDAQRHDALQSRIERIRAGYGAYASRYEKLVPTFRPE